jgi:uncharacterized membrane protein YeiB
MSASAKSERIVGYDLARSWALLGMIVVHFGLVMGSEHTHPAYAAEVMSLTWYFAHIVIGLGTVDALGLSTSQPLPVAEACGALFFAAAVFLSWLWKRRYRHGPLEWVMRTVAG